MPFALDPAHKPIVDQTGKIWFAMKDGGAPVACSVSREYLETLAGVRVVDTPSELLFERVAPLIEEAARTLMDFDIQAIGLAIHRSAAVSGRAPAEARSAES